MNEYSALEYRDSPLRNSGEILNERRSNIIVCFILDGTPQYTSMTLAAVQSFQKTTPKIPVGLLVQNCNIYVPAFLKQLPFPDLVEIRFYSTHFTNWNPTQYKLDLVQFTDKYQTIFWLDSDVVVQKDMTKFLHSFHKSSNSFAFTKDHVMINQDFKKKWPGSSNRMFIPQACFMGFKSSVMTPFFTLWEKKWAEWITPTPFAKYRDPYPSYPNSAFCIEQYALGMAVESLIQNPDSAIFVIPREGIVINSTTTNTSTPQIYTICKTSSWQSSGLSSFPNQFTVDLFADLVIHYYSVNFGRIPL